MPFGSGKQCVTERAEYANIMSMTNSPANPGSPEKPKDESPRFPLANSPRSKERSSTKHRRRRRTRWFERLHRLVHARDLHKDLSAILVTADPKASLEDRILWASQLVGWLRGPTLVENIATSLGAQTSVRVRFLLQLLERHPQWKQSVGRILRSILVETDAVNLFAQTDLTEQGSFFSEFGRRMMDHLAPPPPYPHELSYAVAMMFTHPSDPERIAAIGANEWNSLVNILHETQAGGDVASQTEPLEDSVSLALAKGMVEAMLVLSVQAAAIGLSAQVRPRLRELPAPAPQSGRRPSPFVRLNHVTSAWCGGQSNNDSLLKAIEECQEAVQSVYDGIDQSGVSLEMVYRLETISGLLRRMKRILTLLTPFASAEGERRYCQELFEEVVRTIVNRRSLGHLFNLNVDIFARKLVEHAGESGEHYITRNRKEYWEMLRSGAGGGVITVATTLVKFVITHLKAPLFFEGLFVWINYSASFLAMQFLHFSLATKQPSMTAAALAGKLSMTMNRSQIGEFVEEVLMISRSQFAAILGNVGLVMPGAFLANLLFASIVARPVIDAEYARKVLESVHPWQSLSLFYAAITGMLLWLSSLGAGWLQNWVIFRGLPDSVAHNRNLLSLLGEQRTHALSDWIRRHASGIGGNVSIGFLLAFVPVAGHFFGLPLDIRHVTLSAGNITFAFCSIGWDELNWRLVVPALLGLFGIGLMNFAVSTAMALLVALRARKVKKIWFYALLDSTWARFKRHPFRFLLPPPREKVAQADPEPPAN